MTHLEDHVRIALHLLNALKALFEKGALGGAAQRLNSYFVDIFTKVMTTFYNREIIEKNFQGITSASINEIAEKCDFMNLKDNMLSLLMAVL